MSSPRAAELFLPARCATADDSIGPTRKSVESHRKGAKSRNKDVGGVGVMVFDSGAVCRRAVSTGSARVTEGVEFPPNETRVRSGASHKVRSGVEVWAGLQPDHQPFLDSENRSF